MFFHQLLNLIYKLSVQRDVFAEFVRVLGISHSDGGIGLTTLAKTLAEKYKEDQRNSKATALTQRYGIKLKN